MKNYDFDQWITNENMETLIENTFNSRNVENGKYDNKSIRSPFRYPGGKFYARNLITSYLPDHKYYIEPMVGGGSIFFHKKKVNSWLNDLDERLINCYLVIRDRVDELIEYLNGIQATKELHKYYKKEFTPSNKFEEAVRYYYLNRTSYSGIMKESNLYWGYGRKYSSPPENWGSHLLKVHDKLTNVKLTSYDFEKVIKNVPEDTFIFIDPPYFNADQDKFYERTFDLEDHIRLMELLKKYSNSFKFLLTYDNVSDIRDMYSWTDFIDDKEWNYMIQRTDDQTGKTNDKGSRYKGKEVFIYNYEVKLCKQTSLDGIF